MCSRVTKSLTMSMGSRRFRGVTKTNLMGAVSPEQVRRLRARAARGLAAAA